jgi:hypothetical protein
MVWFAVTMVALMGFAALALEFTRWESVGTRIQKAADAAALAGAVFMPENLGNKAYNTARETASKNGYTHGQEGVVITTAPGALPNQLRVTISVPTKNPFGAIVGYGDSTIVRTSVGEYQLSQNLGSPQNRYGNDPESGETQPQFWGNVFGPASPKGNGDPFPSVPTTNSTLCPSSTDNCVSSTNKDYTANGYFYGIDVPAGATGALDVEVFDPAFVHVHDNCTEGAVVTALNNAATLTAAQIPGYTGTVTPAQRYASGAASPFCSGDMHYNTTTNTSPWTVWTLRGPDNSTWDPTNNPVVCQAEFPGIYPLTTNDVRGGTSDANRLKSLLQQTTNYPGAVADGTGLRFADFFRRWVRVCSVATPTQGTYYLQVQTATKIDGAATPNGGGANRFSIRAGLGSNFATSNGLRLYGNGKMGIYANATGADTRFYLTRVPPGHAGHRLVLQFFDTGDASQAGDISVLPPTDSNVVSGLFPMCQYTAPPGNSTGPPWGTLTNTASGCKITGVSSSSYNGQWITMQIQVPDDYTCDVGDPLGCWTKLRFTYPAGTTVNDTTAWVAFMLGDPVRLVE